jgi:Kef-type K+ transport system membrane component KefB
VGLILAITAIPVSAVVLMEFGLLKSRLGTTVITAGIIDDVLSLIVFAIIIQLSVNGMTDINYGESVFSIVKIAAFLGGIFLLDFVVKKVMGELPNRFDSFSKYLGTKEAGFGLLLLSAFGLSWLAEAVGLHFIIGTFFAGLIIYKEVIGKENFDRVNSVFSAITFGLFSPIFFAFIGTKFNPQSIFEFLPLFLILLGAAVSGKIVGGFIGGRIAGFSNIQSITIGNLVNSRGMVEIVIASIALELGLIDITIFSVVVAVGIITIVMSPILAKLSIQRFAMEKGNGQS